MVSANLYLRHHNPPTTELLGSRPFVAIPRTGETIIVSRNGKNLRYVVQAVRHSVDGDEPACDVLAAFDTRSVIHSLLERAEDERAGRTPADSGDVWQTGEGVNEVEAVREALEHLKRNPPNVIDAAYIEKLVKGEPRTDK